MPGQPRPVYVVMSARSLPYATLCMESLFKNSIEPLVVNLITDGAEDKAALTRMLEQTPIGPVHRWAVFDNADADARALELFARYPRIQQFRRGHPCWRKVTDPSLFAPDGEEMVIIDPDVYFPNRFRFEETPKTGILLMWQATNCLYPPEVVERAFREGVRLADHTDIGVCQAYNPLDWERLEDVLGRLDGDNLPTWSPHVESIVWAALAMYAGGGHLDPKAWFCWRNTITKRIRVKLLKATGVSLLRNESMRDMKCFHAGGRAKHWLSAAAAEGLLSGGAVLDQPTPIRPYKEYTLAEFQRKQQLRKVAGSLGFFKLVGDHN